MPAITTTLVNRPVWFDLSTSDLEGAKRFYSALFGWTYRDSGPEMGHYTMAFANGSEAAAIAPKMPPSEGSPVAWTVYFGVTDASETADRIRARGGSMMFEPMDVADVGRMGIALDPDGAVFGLWQAGTFAGARVEGEHGSMCWCEVNSTRATENADFYADVFALTVQRMDDPTFTYFTLHDGASAVAGVLQMDEAWAGIPPHWMPYFTVTDIDATSAVVKAGGGELLHGPIPSPYGRIMVARDPHGAVFSYMSA